MNELAGKRTLYVCYFGLREPLVQTQVIPYLREIGRSGIETHLLTFEPELKAWPPDRIEAERDRLAKMSITWHALAYHKRPSVPATLYDVLTGARFIARLHKRHAFDVLHCRVHVPMLMGVLARKISRGGQKLIFDIRGFFPEEYTDAGVWPAGGSIYRAVKRVERMLMREADGFVVLTEKARSILFPGSLGIGADADGRPVEVIPCCVEAERFEGLDDTARAETRRELGIGGRFVLAYVGSFGGWYLTDELMDLFAEARRADPGLFAMILTQRNADTVAEMLRARGFSEDDMLVRSVPPTEIGRYLNAADAAVSFIKNSYSKQASSPTKNAEYLASGLPIIANSGIGDVDEQITADGVGVIVKSFEQDELRRSIEEVKALGDIRERCRESARRRFDLASVGGERYRSLYKRLLGRVR